MHHNVRWLSLLCLLALLLSLTGCGSRPVGILDDGAGRFSEGKAEEDYSIRNSGDLLDELLKKYSDSFYTPTETQLTDEEYEKEQEGKSGDEPTPSGQLPTVRNQDELVELIYRAYSEPADDLRFLATGGYQPDLHQEMFDICCRIERKDPIVGTGVTQWSWYQQGQEYYLHLYYAFPHDELTRMRQEARARVAEVAARLNRAGISEYERVVAVNEYLCDNVYYPPNEPYPDVTHSVYGALVNGCSVCEGYACSAAAILREMGVTSDLVIGYCTNGGCHAWNLVKVDGNWYQLDVTWNDGGGRREEYLLVTDAYMLKSRTWDFGSYPGTPSQAYTP